MDGLLVTAIVIFIAAIAIAFVANRKHKYTLHLVAIGMAITSALVILYFTWTSDLPTWLKLLITF